MEPSSLLLVIQRRAENSRAASFQSHSFSNVRSPQVAVIDAYKGPARSSFVIKAPEPEAKDGKKGSLVQQRGEPLKFNSVVSVNEGEYVLCLEDAKGMDHAKGVLKA